jgi:hypothetical protein
MKALLAILALSLTCTAQAPNSSAVIHPTPTCDGWYGKQVGSNCVLTFRFREMDGLTCVVNANPSPDAGQSPVEIVCTYPTAAMIDKKEAR